MTSVFGWAFVVALVVCMALTAAVVDLGLENAALRREGDVLVQKILDQDRVNQGRVKK